MTTLSTLEQQGKTQMADGWRYQIAQNVLSDAYAAARRVKYSTGSPEMTRLAMAETYCQENPNPLANPGAQATPSGSAAEPG